MTSPSTSAMTASGPRSYVAWISSRLNMLSVYTKLFRSSVCLLAQPGLSSYVFLYNLDVDRLPT